ncbi:signal peptidase I [Enterococcus timonensis]|uniref:signal peptidase I n=1 Tax=Enterococcus timonensis TaxID=1852364 RepID=UPI0008DAFF9A|nr:signal peptidase I [Enterococcus timonensis]
MRDRFWLLFKQLLVAAAIVLFLRGFVLIPVQVTGNSMKNLLHQDDTVIMEKISKIQRFDIVVFTQADGSTLVKRVIGLPGETVAVKNDALYINDEKITEPFLSGLKKKDQALIQFTADFSLSDLTGQEELGSTQYFVMGDNRRMSKDSRDFGPIDQTTIIGKARLVYYPLKHFNWLQ